MKNSANILYNGVNIHKEMAVLPRYETPVVLVHGGAHNHTFWKSHQAELTAAGFNTYAFDWLNHGLSADVPDQEFIERTLADVADNEMVAMTDYLEQEENISVPPLYVSHSMGALVTQIYLQEHEAAGAALLAPVAPAEVGNDRSPIPIPTGKPYKPHFALAYPMFFQGMNVFEAYTLYRKLCAESPAAIMQASGADEVSVDAEKVIENADGNILVVSASKEMLVKPKKAREIAEYYGVENQFIQIAGAGHDGLLLGKHALRSIRVVKNWAQRSAQPIPIEL